MSRGGKGRPGRKSKSKGKDSPAKGTPAKKPAQGAAGHVRKQRPARGPADEGDVRPPAPEIEPAQIRPLDPPEQEALSVMLEEFGVDPGVDWPRGRELRVLARDDWQPRRRIVLVQPGVLGLVDPFKPQTVGLPLAYLARKGARWTLEGACWIAGFAKRRVVHVNPKGETLFLYGRTVLARSVRKVVQPVAAGDEVLVVRARDARCIGIGFAQGPLLERSPDRDAVAVTNRTDRGHYLRDAQEVLE